MDKSDVGMIVLCDEVSDGPCRDSIGVADSDGVSVFSGAPGESAKLKHDGRFIAGIIEEYVSARRWHIEFPCRPICLRVVRCKAVDEKELFFLNNFKGVRDFTRACRKP